jgi:glutamyl-tRNA reductase
MFGDLVLLHLPGSSSTESAAWPDQCFVWKTCLRQIVVCPESQVDLLEEQLRPQNLSGAGSPVHELYCGIEAYRFLLQVICGLHSPLLGETEVYGQFKNAVSEFALPVGPSGGQLRRLFQALFEDAKKIRQHHLVDLGSQSYGSILRRELRGLKQIHVLGAGHLVQEILPWISKDGCQVHVHCRQPEKARGQFKQIENVHLHNIENSDLQGADGLVVAAPVSAAWLASWLERANAGALELIADTRGDSASDRMAEQSAARQLTLSMLHGQISGNQVLLQARKATALKAIDEAVTDRGRFADHRPFGWEDVCA